MSFEASPPARPAPVVVPQLHGPLLAAAGLILPAFQMLEEDKDLADALKAFGKAFLTAISTPDVVAFRRVLAGEGARSGIGPLFYQSGPLMGLTRLAGFMERQMALGRMKTTVPAFTAAEQFIALCESGPLRLHIQGVRGPISPDEIAEAAERAAALFTSGYGEADPDPQV